MDGTTGYTTYRNHRAEPYFTFLKEGKKTVEGRIRKSWYAAVQSGDRIIVSNNEETESIPVRVKAVRMYTSIREMLEKEHIQQVLPDVTSIDEGIAVYRRFYTEEQENTFGVVAIEVEKINATTHEMHLNDIDVIKVMNQEKTVEGRLFDAKRQAVAIGDTIIFSNSTNSMRIAASVQELVITPRFKNLFEQVTPAALGHETIEDYRSVYTYYSRADEEHYGAVGIVLTDIRSIE